MWVLTSFWWLVVSTIAEQRAFWFQNRICDLRPFGARWTMTLCSDHARGSSTACQNRILSLIWNPESHELITFYLTRSRTFGIKHYLCFGRYLTGVLTEIWTSYYFAYFWFSTAIHDPAYLDSPSTLPSCFLQTLSARPRFKLGIMLFPLQRDCDDATMTLTMTVTIQARDQDVPSKIDLPMTADISVKTNCNFDNIVSSSSIFRQFKFWTNSKLLSWLFDQWFLSK